MAFKRYLALLGVILFFLVLSQIHLSQVFTIWGKANIFYLGLALVGVIGVLLLKVLKWSVLIKAYSDQYSLSDCINFWCIGFFLSLMTPGRVGDLSRALYLREHVSIPQGFLTVIVDRLMDVVLLLIWSMLAVFMFSIFFQKTIFSIYLLAGFLLFLIFSIWFFSKEKNIKLLLRPFFQFFIPENLKEKIKLNFSNFYTAIRELKKNKARLTTAFALGFLSWLVVIGIGYAIVLALNLPLPPFFLLVLMPIISLVDLVPISISGLGTREVTTIFLFSFYNLSSELAVAFSVTYLLVSYVSIALLGLAFFIRQPIELSWAQ